MENPIRETIVKTANSFIGQEEIRGNLGFKDDQFEEMMKAVGWRKKQAWCAYFAELVWKLGFVHHPDSNKELDKLFSASAVQTWKNFSNSSWLANQTPQEGAVAIWQTYRQGNPHWTGHVAIVTGIASINRFITVEGNTNPSGGREGYTVAQKNRNLSSVNTESGLRLLGFIHPERNG